MANDYRERAAECLRMANETVSFDHRASLLDMALAWLRLHDQAEKNSQTDLAFETSTRPPGPGRQLQSKLKRDTEAR
jgi:hypothetical protein